MNFDTIRTTAIDEAGRLCVTPVTQEFSMVYRAAMEVHWDHERGCLYAPKPREWTYLDWFKQIIRSVESEYGCRLRLDESTRWENIPPDLETEIRRWMTDSRDPRL